MLQVFSQHAYQAGRNVYRHELLEPWRLLSAWQQHHFSCSALPQEHFAHVPQVRRQGRGWEHYYFGQRFGEVFFEGARKSRESFQIDWSALFNEILDQSEKIKISDQK